MSFTDLYKGPVCFWFQFAAVSLNSWWIAGMVLRLGGCVSVWVVVDVITKLQAQGRFELIHSVVQMFLRCAGPTRENLKLLLLAVKREYWGDKWQRETVLLLLLEGADPNHLGRNLSIADQRVLITRGILPPSGGVDWDMHEFRLNAKRDLHDAVYDAADLSDDVIRHVLSFLW